MKPKQTLKTKDGVEVALYPDTVVQYAPHTEYIAYDLGGKQTNYLYAPTKAKVAKCDKSNQWHSAYFHCYGLTPKGVAKFTMLAMHDNDVSDLIVGKEFAQGELLYTEGGFGPNGPKSYASHIHIQVCFGWVTQTVKNELGKWTLKGACPINEVFFVNGTEVITQGLEWQTYEPTPKENSVVEPEPVSVVEPNIVETPTETPVNTIVNESTEIVNEIVNEWTPTVEPITPPQATIEPTPSNNTNETQTTPTSHRNGLYAIIEWLIRVLLLIFRGRT